MRHVNTLAFWSPDQAAAAAASTTASSGGGGILSSIGGALSNVIGAVTGAVTSPGGVQAISQYWNYRLSRQQVGAGQQPTGLPGIQTPQNPNPMPAPTTYAPPGGVVTAGPNIGGIDPTLLYVGGGVLIVVLLLTAGRK